MTSLADAHPARRWIILVSILVGACAPPYSPVPSDADDELTDLIQRGHYPAALDAILNAPETPELLRAQAALLADLGRLDEVQHPLGRLAASQPVDRHLRASIAIIRGRVSLGLGETEAATLHARRALDLLEPSDSPTDITRVQALLLLCRANVLAGRVDAARRFCGDANAIVPSTNDPGLTTEVHLAASEAALLANDLGAAIAAADLAVEIASASGHTAHLWRALRLSALAQHRHGNASVSAALGDRSVEALAALRAAWGPEAAARYLHRHDLKPLLR